MIEPSAEGCRYAGFVRIGRVRRQHLRVLLDRSPATGFVDDDIDVEIATLLDLRKGEDGSRCYRVTVTPTGTTQAMVAPTPSRPLSTTRLPPIRSASAFIPLMPRPRSA